MRKPYGEPVYATALTAIGVVLGQRRTPGRKALSAVGRHFMGELRDVLLHVRRAVERRTAPVTVTASAFPTQLRTARRRSLRASRPG
jgi:hypothetical protein